MAIAVLDTEGHWMVDTTHIYVPQSFHVEHTNVASADSGRTENGIMHIGWVRRDVRKVTLTFNVLTGNELHTMLDLMQGQEYYFTYFDQTVQSFQGYTGDCDYELYSEVLYASEGGMYKDFTIDVVEI